LYGRRLVLEWADEENDTVEGLRRKTAAEFGKLIFEKKKKKNNLVFLDLNSTSKRLKRSELLGELRKMGGNDQTLERKTTEEDE
jgi:hypothetical protein